MTKGPEPLAGSSLSLFNIKGKAAPKTADITDAKDNEKKITVKNFSPSSEFPLIKKPDNHAINPQIAPNAKESFSSENITFTACEVFIVPMPKALMTIADV